MYLSLIERKANNLGSETKREVKHRTGYRRKKRGTEDVNNTVKQQDLTDIYRILHQTTA